ncbi:MAG: glycosyl transferase family 2 [Chloroflexi bacterium]|jgi:GT2 family glycosyltransferase|nr:glycosyl transferase family 2 [Chloroflexota bacterium]
MGTVLPHVSVVVCTRNRPDTIEQAVMSVLANNYHSFDLTVIDQSTTQATESILRPIAEGDRRLRYVLVQEAGLSRAYNTAIACTEGDVLAFTDDDCVTPSDWLSKICHAFAEDEEADLIYGQVIAPEMSNVPGGITPALALRRPERFSRRDGFRVLGMGANFAARRSLFTRVGGFDEQLGGGAPLCSSQDFDLAYRTYRSGRAILARPDVHVLHYGTRTPQDWPATLRAYGIGDGAFYFKHVRCLDLFALRLLARQMLVQSARDIGRRLRGRGPGNLLYVRFILVGIRESLRFKVDRHARLYVAR